MVKYTIPIVATLALLACCKKEDPKQQLRSKTYQLYEYKNSGLSGTVSFVETDDKTKTTVRLNAWGLKPNIIYLTHLHTGAVDSLTGTLIYFNNLQTTGTSVERDETWDISYDAALTSNTCFTIHDPDFFANNPSGYFLAGNTGANAQ